MKILFVFHSQYCESKTFHMKTMSLAVVKSMNRNGAKVLRSATHNLFRMMGTTNEPSPGKSAEQQKAKEPSSPPPKTEPSPAPSGSAPTCPDPPPCPPPPQCPPTPCPTFADSGNPCDYTPPPCTDPSTYNMARIKKWQCFFQEENDIPLYLKRGNIDALLFQSTTALTLFLIAHCLYKIFAKEEEEK